MADTSVLVPFRLAVQERGLGVEGVHVHQRGQRPVEHHTTIDNRRNVHSVAKTFTAVAIGIARDQGVLNLDDRAAPETSCARCGLSCCPRWRQPHRSGNRYHLPGGGAALCGLDDLQAGHGVPGVDRHGTSSAYRVGE